MKRSYKLSVQDVIDIRDDVSNGLKISTVARRRGISDSVVGRIVARKLWAHVMADGRIATRRRANGEKHHSAKLTFAKVYKVKQRLAAGESYPSIAKDYKVSPNNIRYIDIGKIWKHVPRPSGMEASRS